MSEIRGSGERGARARASREKDDPVNMIMRRRKGRRVAEAVKTAVGHRFVGCGEDAGWREGGIRIRPPGGVAESLGGRSASPTAATGKCPRRPLLPARRSTASRQGPLCFWVTHTSRSIVVVCCPRPRNGEALYHSTRCCTSARLHSTQSADAASILRRTADGSVPNLRQLTP